MQFSDFLNKIFQINIRIHKGRMFVDTNYSPNQRTSKTEEYNLADMYEDIQWKFTEMKLKICEKILRCV